MLKNQFDVGSYLFVRCVMEMRKKRDIPWSYEENLSFRKFSQTQFDFDGKKFLFKSNSSTENVSYLIPVRLM